MKNKVNYALAAKKNKILFCTMILSCTFSMSVNAQLEVQTSGDVKITKNLAVGTNTANRTKNNKDGYMPLMDNTSWTMISYSFEPPTMAYVYKIFGDTLIGDKTHYILKKYTINVNDGVVYPDVTSGTTTKYFYEDIENKQVYQYSDYYKRDILIYDFNVKLGDKLPTTDSLRISMDTLFTLEDISSFENAGYSRKIFTFKHGTTDSIVWIEGIGNYVDFSIPYALKKSVSSRILCVQNKNQTIYDTGDFQGHTCETIETIINNFSQGDVVNAGLTSFSAHKIFRDGHLYIKVRDMMITIDGRKIR